MVEYNIVEKPKTNAEILEIVKGLKDNQAFSITLLSKNKLHSKRSGLLVESKKAGIKIHTRTEDGLNKWFLYVYKA